MVCFVFPFCGFYALHLYFCTNFARLVSDPTACKLVMRIDTAAQMQLDSGKISLVGGLGLFNLGKMFCVQCVLIQEIPHCIE